MNHSLGPQRKRERERRDGAAGRGGGGCSKGNGVDFSGPSTEAGGRSRGAQGSPDRLQWRDGRSVRCRPPRPPPSCPWADRVGLQISLMKPLASSPRARLEVLQKMSDVCRASLNPAGSSSRVAGAVVPNLWS